MSASIAALPAPGPQPLDLMNTLSAPKLPAGADKAKLQAAARDFEAVFINAMVSQMVTGLDGEGPFGGSGATGMWRSLLTQEYSKSFAKAGGLGMAQHVYRSLLAHQEARQ